MELHAVGSAGATLVRSHFGVRRGYVFTKGSYTRLRSDGLPELRASLAKMVPWLAERVDVLRDWQQTAMLSVESDRLRRWYAPGLLLIGDAAHTMSPVGGMGINLAIQDAVAAANRLARPLRRGEVRVRDLAAIQRRREWPTRVIQRLQSLMQRQLLVEAGRPRLSHVMRVLLRMAPVRDARARLLAFGGWSPERLATASL